MRLYDGLREERHEADFWQERQKKFLPDWINRAAQQEAMLLRSEEEIAWFEGIERDAADAEKWRRLVAAVPIAVGVLIGFGVFAVAIIWRGGA